MQYKNLDLMKDPILTNHGDKPTHSELFLQDYPPTQAFAVVSWGCAATSWLAKILNSHPDIFCVHAFRSFCSILGNVAAIDDLTYIKVIASQGHAHKAAGDIHGIDRYNIQAIRNAFGKRFNAVVVVRAPEPRLLSMLSLFERYKSLKLWDTSFAKHLIGTYNLRLPSGTYEEEFFVHGANMLNAIVDEQDVGSIYRCEDLTSHAETLGVFIEELTRGEVMPTREWLRLAVQCEKINKHRTNTKALAFTDWQIEVMQKIVTPKAWDYYLQLGYKLPAWHKP